MHLHISRVRRDGKTYEYGQLVESFRRSDGMPTQRIVARLGRLSPLEAENLRTTLRASRAGQRVVLDRQRLPKGATFISPTQNLRYLDLAVLLELWRTLGVDRLLEELLPRGQSEVAAADVVAALTLQRCVDPGSKLYAERWFPRTALPELLGIAPGSFHNTRLHRVLEQLDEATGSLMARLPRLYREPQGEPFAALFLDVSDARFVGHGPPLAEAAKTKEGIVAQKVGIVLLCNDHGYPLRWHVIAGKKPDAPAMHDLMDEVRGLEWVGTTPVVCDRSMGTSSEIGKLLGRGLRFITALRSTEFGAYSDAIPHGCVADLEPSRTPPSSSPDPCLTEAVRRVEQAGMKRESDTLYVLDLNIVQRDALAEPRAAGSTDPTVQVLSTARQLHAMVEGGTADSFVSAGRKLGLSPGKTKHYRKLLRLERGLQQDILDGKAAGLSLNSLYRLARLDDAATQRSVLDRLLLNRKAKPVMAPTTSPSAPAPIDQVPEQVVLRVRAVAFFNPERFVTERRHALLQLEQVQAYVDKLNGKLAHPRSRRKPRSIELDLDRMLRRKSLLDVFHVHVDQQQLADGTTRYKVRAELHTQRWQQRRRYDGFSLLVAHPEVTLPAAELCRLYRAKDAVEKDFQTIKSLVKIRPIWHRTDVKVRAHVTLCMLALLLERMLDQRLRDTSATMALEVLAGCCLNRFEDVNGKSRYLVTRPDAEQREVLRELRLEDLADGADLIDRIRPRPPVAST